MNDLYDGIRWNKWNDNGYSTGYSKTHLTENGGATILCGAKIPTIGADVEGESALSADCKRCLKAGK